MKIVEAYGEQLQLPDWANYIAADSNGSVWAYSLNPIKDPESNQWLTVNMPTERINEEGIRVSLVSNCTSGWDNSLINIELYGYEHIPNLELL